VLGHELNNSLAPIKSIAGSLRACRRAAAGDWDEDMRRDCRGVGAGGVAVAVHGSYSRLARLPPPQLQPVEVGPVPGGSPRDAVSVEVQGGAKRWIRADGDQLSSSWITC
jgi:hypothetical protein